MIYQFEWSKIETCDECPLLDWEQASFCVLTEKAPRVNFPKATPRPKDCPLVEK